MIKKKSKSRAIMKSITMRRRTKSKVIMKNIIIMNTTTTTTAIAKHQKRKVKFMIRNSSIIKKRTNIRVVKDIVTIRKRTKLVNNMP
jgi:hypothetical protein